MIYLIVNSFSTREVFRFTDLLIKDVPFIKTHVLIST